MNSLRRQNSESLQQREGSSRVESVEDTRKPAEDDDICGDSACRTELGSTSGPEVESAVGTAVEKLGSSASNVLQRSDIVSNREVQITATGCPPSPSDEPPPPSGGAEQQLQGDSASAAYVEPPLPVSPASKPRHPLFDTDVIGNNRTQTQTRPRPRCRADCGGGEDDNQEFGTERARESDIEPAWLISPSGEKTRQSTSGRRKSPESQRRHPYRRPSEDGEEQLCGIRSRTSANAGWSPGGGSTDRVEVATAVIQTRQAATAWRPAGSNSGLRPQQQWLSRSQPATPSRRHRGNTHKENNNNAEGVHGKGGPGSRLSPTRGEDGSAAVNATGPASSKPHWRAAGGAPAQPPWQQRGGGGSGTRLSSSQPVTPFRSLSDGASARGSDEPDGDGKPRSAVSVSPGTSGAITSPECCGAGAGDHHMRGVDAVESVDAAKSVGRAALSDSTVGGLRRSRDHRHREPQRSPAPRRESRRRSSNTVTSFDSDRYYTAAVRCDRYGYPVHEREGLGGSGAAGGGGGGRVFSPMIKGLPDFYESRPRRRGRGGDETAPRDDAAAGQSLYARTTDWQAKASELR